MCAERVGQVYLEKQDDFMFTLQSKYIANIYIGIKNMMEGWWQKQRCNRVSFDRDLAPEGAI